MTACVPSQPAESPRPLLLGADISLLAHVEKEGGAFRDAQEPADDAIAIFTRHGWNCFRLRIFVNPNGARGVVNSLAYTRALAKRIKASGATFILDFHYSDTWADPQHQVKPAAWADLSFDALEKEVERYTADVLRDLQDAGASPDIVQIGNEIIGGTLWPDAQVRVPHSDVKVYDETVKPIEPPQPYDDAKQWDRLTRVIKAGVRGVDAASKNGRRPKILIHIDCGGDWPVTQWFFDHLVAADVPFDLVGQSYYPNWHGTLENVRDNLHRTAERYGKDILIVETAYPKSQPDRWAARKNMAWPVSPEGQRQFLIDLIETVKQTPGGRGAGVVYWQPESLDVRRKRSGATALFDDTGAALPAIGIGDQKSTSRPSSRSPG